MDTKLIKEKIINGQISEEELSALLGNTKKTYKKESFLKTIVKGYTDVYAVPNMYKNTLEAILIFVILIGGIVLSYVGKMDTTTIAVLFAAVLGFLFGKIR
ncbi:MAG: hypothetical protein ABIP51_09285 [Bacteroidia bacterium]